MTKILIVEDETALQTLLKYNLEKQGYETAAVMDGRLVMRTIADEKPDLILVPGDMIISKYTETFPVAYHAFEELVKIAPVYFSYGNHESRVSKVTVRQTRAYLKYEEKVRRLGVHFLRNDSYHKIHPFKMDIVVF